jgi:hypothetical protein
VNIALGMCYQLVGAFASGVSLAAFYGGSSAFHPAP